MPQSAFQVTEDFELALSAYTGAPFVVTYDNCSNAIKACLAYEGIKGQRIGIPCRTYMSVPCEIIMSGNSVEWLKVKGDMIKGAYLLNGTRIWDSALRFTNDMYIKGSLMCLSFSGPHKHLKLGKGGAILCDTWKEADFFKRYRFSGRGECSYHDDNFTMLGGNYYMLPEIAAKGLRDMAQFYNADGSPRSNQDLELPYPDLSKFEVYNKQHEEYQSGYLPNRQPDRA